MSRSASCYTNLRKTIAMAKNTKVDYPGHVANNWNPLAPALGCNPRFEENTYMNIQEICSSKPNTIQKNLICSPSNGQTIITIYDGGYNETESTNDYSGNGANNTSTIILDGGYSTTQ